MTIRVLIVDDHKVVRQGLRMFLALDPELEIVGEAVNGEEAVLSAREIHPDVVLMDLLMPKLDGIQATQRIRSELPDVEVIALTSVLEDDGDIGSKSVPPGSSIVPHNRVVEAIRAGAIGYLMKDTEPEALCQAIRAAAAGQVQISPQAAAQLVREVRSPGSPESLTQRETDTLRLVAQGLANKEIAGILKVSETTVKTHVSNILAKLGLPSRTQAALYAVRAGLVPNTIFQEK